MWGSLLFVSRADVAMLFVLRPPVSCSDLLPPAAGRPAFQPGRGARFGLHDAPAAGVHGPGGVVITINLKITGGLLMDALLTNPGRRGLRVGRAMPAARRLAAGLGIGSTLGGFGVS